MDPLVSVVIPTYKRASMCLRAVCSALEQTFSTIEVIVVVDGGDEATVTALAGIDDSRLRVFVPPARLGNADARNYGVSMANAIYIAFLDDDDLWMPRKLDTQLQVALSTQYLYPVISCRMVGRAEAQDFLWPRRHPRLSEPLCEYLFCRRSPFAGEGTVQTSTILTTRRLLERVPFAGGMRRYVDLDWLLRAAQLDGVGVEFPRGREPLAIWHMEEDRARVSNGVDGDYSLRWARERRHLFTAKAYASFLLWIVSADAARAKNRKAFWPLLCEAGRRGKIRPVDLLTHAANFSLPRQLLRRVAGWHARCRQWSIPNLTQSGSVR